MCGVYLNNRNRDEDFMLSLNETIDQLAMAHRVCRHGHVLRREGGHVLSRAFDF